MHDVLLAQNHKRPLPFDHNFERSSFLSLDLPEEFTSRAVGTLQIWGKRGLGKTEWALSQFENPLYVTERNVLLDFRPGWHDGPNLDTHARPTPSPWVTYARQLFATKMLRCCW